MSQAETTVRMLVPSSFPGILKLQNSPRFPRHELFIHCLVFTGTLVGVRFPGVEVTGSV